MKCFLVDESDLTRKSLKQYLSDIDNLDIVGEAANEKEAIIGITRTAPDIIITDIKNNNNDSIKLIKKAKYLFPLTIVIVFMDSQYPQYKNLCLEVGADHFFSKPEEIEELYALLIRIIDNTA